MSPEPEARDHLSADHVAKFMLAPAVASRAGDHHQRQKVFFARVASSGSGRPWPRCRRRRR